ncbi:hypothetical protein GCM10010464_26860 [Pseudonocardia yunnanensis]|uniref:Uncharacterized protein n=1 Tax=Pseudonocardia yunnanensis TaxID=58107 RepID=A0ABW4F4Z1_9PSEU
MTRTVAFLRDQPTDHLLHAVEAFPHLERYGLLSSFASTRHGEAVSAVHALIDVWFASADGDSDRLIHTYDRCLGVARWAFAPDNWQDREQFLRLLLRQATADRHNLPDALLDRMAMWYAELIQIGELPEDVAGRLQIWA